MSGVIKDPQILLGMIERGELVVALVDEVESVIHRCQDAAGNKGKAKGKVTLTLAIEIEGSTCTIHSDLASKAPKPVRESSLFFVTGDGKLSTEHPQQISMFPRDADADRRRG